MEKFTGAWESVCAFLASIKEQGVGATLAFLMAWLRGRYQEKKWRKTLIDATICAIIAWFARDLLALFGLSAGLVYLASVFIGYLGTDFLGEALTDSLPFRGLRLSVKKPDTRKKNDNQRRRGKSD
ncbi:MAG: phage holin, lambda family [Candidatus Arsenophonus phytopathogenicus]